MMYRKLYLLVMLLLAMPSSFAQDALTLDRSPQSLKNHLYWLQTEDALTIEQVEMLSVEQFNAPLDRDFSHGYQSSQYWFRFELDFTEASQEAWLLEIPFPLLDQVTFYQPNTLGGFESIETGDRRLFADRPKQVHRFVFPLVQQAGKATYYLHVRTQDSLQVPLEVWPESQYLAHYSFDLGLQMAFFGALLVMIAYNLFIYFSTRDRNYLFYVAFIGLMVLFQLGLQGLSHQWLWPESPWWSNISIPVFGVASLLCGLLFVRNLLQTRQALPKFDRVLRWIAYSMIVTIPLILLGDYDIAIYASLAVTSIFFNFTLVAIILMVLKGDRTAKIVLAAWSIFLIAGTISMLGIVGWLPTEVAGTHALQVGSMLEVVLLSLALADRIKTLRQEKLDMEIMSSDILRVSNEQLERSNRMKDAFIATISHEIKTPMNAILGSSQLLRENANTDQTEYLDIIDRSGATLLSILDNVLDFSRLQADRLKINETEVNLPQLLTDVTKLFEVQLTQPNVRIWLTYGKRYPQRFISDELLLKQALMNLISNALKFTESGFIWVHSEVNDENQLLIEVRDSGIGMSPEQQKNIFIPFSQAEDSTSRRYGGTGLGLVITKKITELLGGHVAFHSELGVGSGFQLYLPMQWESFDSGTDLNIPTLISSHQNEQKLFKERVSNQHTAPQSNIYASVKNNGVEVGCDSKKLLIKGVITADKLNKTIERLQVKTPIDQKESEQGSERPWVLAVDDDPTNRLIIGKVLSRLGVEYVVADGGPGAIEAIKRQTFDLVLMDIEMPEMDGYETTREIRKWEVTEALDPLRIVALSAHVASEFKEKAMAAGMNDFMNKPIDLARIKQEINQIKRDVTS